MARDMTLTSSPTPAVLPDARALIDRLTANIETQRVLIEQTPIGSLEREAARLAYAVMKDARYALLTPPASDAAVPAGFIRRHHKLGFECYSRDKLELSAGQIEAGWEQIPLYEAAAPKVASNVLTEEWLADVLQDSLEMDWTSTDGARAIMRALQSSTIATECPASPDGQHQVDTSMEEGPNNCFHCSAKMGANHAR